MRLIICLLLIATVAGDLCGQRKSKRLMTQRERELAYIRTLLDNGDREQAGLDVLNILNEQIRKRETLIEAIDDEIIYINEAINENERIILSLEQDLANLKAEYAAICRHDFKTRGKFNYLTLLMSAESYKQAYRRLKYIEYYNEHRKNQIKLIKEMQTSLEGKNEDLRQRRIRKRELQTKYEQETVLLNRDKSRKTYLVNLLNGRTRDLKQELEADAELARNLDEQLIALIKQEQQRIEDAKHNEADKQLTEAFAKRKRRLPMPVENGIVTGKFGRSEHPDLDGIILNNSGIDISTQTGTAVFAVYDGEVTRVVDIAGSGKAVILKHGDYFTVYRNVGRIEVFPGDSVTRGQQIAAVAQKPGGTTGELHFEVWHKTAKQNPSAWLRR